MHYAIPITQRLRKLVRSLNQKQFRDQHDLFLAEGAKLAQEILLSDYEPELLVVRDSPTADVLEMADKFSEMSIPIYNAPKHQFDQMCTTKTPQGIVVVLNKKEQIFSPNESFIALDGVTDPGNIGTIIRTADWFGFKQIIMNENCADHLNPKAVRSTMGGVFRVNVHHVESLADTIKESFSKIETFGASLDAKKELNQLKATKKIGLVFGSESHGFTPEVDEVIKNKFIIKGFGLQESLNVAVAAGITFYHFKSLSK